MKKKFFFNDYEVMLISFVLVTFVGAIVDRDSDIFAGIFLAGTVATATFYLFKFFMGSWRSSGVPMLAAIMMIAVIMGMHVFMSIKLQEIRKEFLTVVKTADSKILWGAGEFHPGKGSATNPITYSGKLDLVVKKRNALLKKWGFVGIGTWSTNEYREVQFQMAYIFWPFTKLKL